MEQSQSQPKESSSFWLPKAEGGSLPDFATRFGICKQLHNFANTDLAPGGAKYDEPIDFIDRYLRKSQESQTLPNGLSAEHAGLSAEFFETCLGDSLNFGCGYWPELEWYMVNEKPSTSMYRDVITGTSGMTREFEKSKSIRQSLSQAEVNMIRVMLARAEVREKQCVLDFGCEWGAATLYALENLTQVKIVAVTGSQAQADYVKKLAQKKKVNDRLLVITCELEKFGKSQYVKQVKDFMGKEKFDRVYSVGSFEYLRNWENILDKLQEEWLEEEGKILLQFIAHRSRAYVHDQQTWLGKNFLKDRIMPSHDLLKQLDKVIGTKLEIEAEYKVNGRHFSKTAEAWLKIFDQEKVRVIKFFEQAYGKDRAKLKFNQWRVFFLTYAEAFGMREGTEWFVSDYLLRRWRPKQQEPEKVAEEPEKAEEPL